MANASDRLCLAMMLFDHGAKSPMWSDSRGDVEFDSYGNVERPASYDENSKSFRSLLKDARIAAEELFNDEARESELDTKIVNAIGQTARAYAGGTNGLWTALRRIKQDDGATAEQKLVLRMYASAG